MIIQCLSLRQKPVMFSPSICLFAKNLILLLPRQNQRIILIILYWSLPSTLTSNSSLYPKKRSTSTSYSVNSSLQGREASPPHRPQHHFLGWDISHWSPELFTHLQFILTLCPRDNFESTDWVTLFPDENLSMDPCGLLHEEQTF